MIYNCIYSNEADEECLSMYKRKLYFSLFHVLFYCLSSRTGFLQSSVLSVIFSDQGEFDQIDKKIKDVAVASRLHTLSYISNHTVISRR